MRREKETEREKSGGIRAFSRTVPKKRENVVPNHCGQLRGTAVVVSSVKAVHCRDRFERTRLKMEARKVFEARLWSAENPG